MGLRGAIRRHGPISFTVNLVHPHRFVRDDGASSAQYLYRDPFPTAALGREIPNKPVEVGHRQNSRDDPGRLPERQPEQDLLHQAAWIALVGRAAPGLFSYPQYRGTLADADYPWQAAEILCPRP